MAQAAEHRCGDDTVGLMRWPLDLTLFRDAWSQTGVRPSLMVVRHPTRKARPARAARAALAHNVLARAPAVYSERTGIVTLCSEGLTSPYICSRCSVEKGRAWPLRPTLHADDPAAPPHRQQATSKQKE